MARNCLVYTLLCLGVVYSIHDHSLHPDKNFVSQEVNRCAFLDKTELIKNIGEYKYTITEINNRFLTQFDPETSTEKAINYFKNTVAKTYRRTYDRLLIASKACVGLYQDEECEISSDLWISNIDLRGAQFVTEFAEELDRVVDLTVYSRKKRDAL